MDRRKRSSQAAFTLIELLVVILIVGILIGLLVPAVMAAIRKAHEAQVTAEMNSLATALASFKNLYGDYPPSRVLLVESGYGSLTSAQLSTAAGPLSPSGVETDISVQQLRDRSLIYLSRFWPRVDFVSTSHDFNGDGSIAANPGTPHVGYFVLSGSECLTFFLGGLPINNGNGTYAMSGFSKSPLDPFVNSALQSNRVVPQYEFSAGRLIDQDGDGIPSYIDPLNTTPGSRRAYAYFFSYGSNAYDPNDDNGYGHRYDGSMDDASDFETDDTVAATYTEWGFQVGFSVGGSTTPPYYAISPAPNPYTTGPTEGSSISWINPTTFQLICSGQDGYWGPGGTYVGSGTGASLPAIGGTTPGNQNAITVRVRENDNLTSFSGGRLN
jgi:general secretion pathway protein G